MDDVMTLFDNAPPPGMPGTRTGQGSILGGLCHPGAVIHQRSPEQGNAMLSDEAFAGVTVGYSTGHDSRGLWPRPLWGSGSDKQVEAV